MSVPRARRAAAGAAPAPRDALPAARPGILAALRTGALAATGILVAAATLVSFAESYRGLLDWASGHGLAGFWAAAWPLQVDVFICVGELSLFVALVDQWPGRSRILPWAVTLGGLAVSVSANVGHVPGHSAASHVTAAVPPLAASAALSVGLGVLKRVVRARHPPRRMPGPRKAARHARPAVQAAPAGAAGGPGGPGGGPQRAGKATAAGGPTAGDVARHYRNQLAAGALPSQRAIRDTWGVGAGRARKLHDELAAMVAGDRQGLPPAVRVRRRG
jgi:hypothetical protein